MARWSPHAKYRHVFPVVRVDRHDSAEMTPSRDISVIKVLWTQEAAEKEVERLRRINADKGCTYFWTISRLIPEEREPHE